MESNGSERHASCRVEVAASADASSSSVAPNAFQSGYRAAEMLADMLAGKKVKNFDQLKVGDQVDLQYIEAMTLELKKGGGMVVSRTEKADAVGAKKGETPGGAVGRQVTIVADVVAVDAAKQTISLKGPKETVTMRIPDPEQFKRIAKGDQVEAKFTQAVAIAVAPAAKK